MRNDFAIFILTHGRPNKQFTLRTFLNCGYTGMWYLVLDDTDDTIQQYIDIYGSEHIIVFDKNYYINSDRFDNGDNSLHAKSGIYARRAIEDIVKDFNLHHFIMADDDIINLSVRYPYDGVLKRYPITNIDEILEAHIQLLHTVGIASIGFGNTTHYFSGCKIFESTDRLLPYHIFLRNADIDINWVSWICDDDVTEYLSSSVGNVWLVSLFVMYDVEQVGNVNAVGGMVETYKNVDPYILSFSGFKYFPNQIMLKYSSHKKKIVFSKRKDCCFPQLISSKFRKEI